MLDCPPLLALSAKALPSQHGHADYHWRVSRPLARIRERGVDAAECWLDADERPTISPAGRLVILQRVAMKGAADGIRAWVRSLRDAGALAVVFEIDDDEISPACLDWMRSAGGLELVGLARLERERLALLATMQACDAVTVSTEPLAEVVRRYTDRPVYVVPNAIDVAWFRDRLAARPAWADHLTIGWAGGRRPDADIEPMAVAWGRIARHHPQVRFVVAGWQPDCIYREVDDIDRIVRLPWQALDDYPRAYQVDIGCTPLAMSDFNRAKCVTGDTLIYTEDGLQPISNLVESRIIGEEIPLNIRVWTTQGWAMATGGLYQGEQDLVKVTTKAGFVIEGTPTHPVRRSDQSWAMLGDLVVGDLLKIEPVQFARKPVTVTFNPWAIRERRDADHQAPSLPTVQIDESWGAMLGYLVGDGSISKNAVGITCDIQDQDVIEDVVRTFAALGINASRQILKDGRRCENVRVSSARLNDFLWRIGIYQEKRKSLAVPHVILRSPKPVVRAFLRALFESDGTVFANNPTASLSTMSLRLAREVQLLLTGFGIMAYIRTSFNKVYQRDYYSVVLRRAACDQFAKEIGFIGARKNARLSEITARPHSNAFREQVWSDDVVKIERNGTGGVFDLVVPGPSEFGAAGFMVHNSPIKLWEYGLAGAAVVASPTVYMDEVAHGAAAFLAETADEWEMWLRLLIERESMRRTLAAGLLRHTEGLHGLTANLHRWTDAYREIAARVGAGVR